MFFSLIALPLTAVLGYLYPAYMTYKAVEKRQPNIDELHYWSKYWVLIGALCAAEMLTLGFITWIPFYSTLRLVFMVYLWHPRTQGVMLVYLRGLQPFMLRNEESIDKSLHELHTRGADMAMDSVRRLVSGVQSAAQQGQGMVAKRYQRLTSHSANPYPVYPPPGAGGSAAAGAPSASTVPDSMYNLRSRKGGYDS